jgi:hypothetical protein
MCSFCVVGEVFSGMCYEVSFGYGSSLSFGLRNERDWDIRVWVRIDEIDCYMMGWNDIMILKNNASDVGYGVPEYD